MVYTRRLTQDPRSLSWEQLALAERRLARLAGRLLSPAYRLIHLPGILVWPGIDAAVWLRELQLTSGIRA